ncbi:MAG: glutathione S-transferase family protein [Alphaproteobacteria bacterium]|nr:glutathione S-transferase family protein [Alphaproteobacteria bacterium]
MPLKLYSHPLASFCHKALIALYEGGVAFEPVLVDFGDARSVAAFKAVWPMAKMPVLHDEQRGRTVAESTAVIEYLDAFYPGAHRLLPADPDRAWQARMWDRFYDHYVHEPMQKIVTDRLRPQGAKDGFGVDQAHALIGVAYAVADRALEGKTWMLGDDFTLADCAAAPALFYADLVAPLGAHQHLSGYLDRLMARPSYARVLAEAEPYFGMFPMDNKPKRVRSGAAPA